MNNSRIVINENITVMRAMELLDEVAKKVLFVVRENKFVAAVTDGDIRRWILTNGDLQAKVNMVANYSPLFIRVEEVSKARSFMKEHVIEAVPVLNDMDEIIDIIFLQDNDLPIQTKISLPVVIMAGGQGTRLYPYTKILPKPLIPIGELPIVEHIINRFHQYGCEDFHLIVNHKRNMIKAYFNDIERGYNISYVDEDIPLDTGGGLGLLKGKIDSTFVLSNCDILIDEDYSKIYKHHKEEKNLITMVCSLKKVKIPYGVIETDEKGLISSMKEKPEFSFLTNTGVYIVEPKVIEELEAGVAISFPDIIDKYRKHGEKVGIYPISEYNWMDMGEFQSLEEMKRRLEK